MTESTPPRVTVLSAERLKAFTDAVVAIAMTLLILPLMESVGEAGRERLSAGEWLGDQVPALFSLVLSFVLIALFWITHHRLFERVEHVTPALLWLSVAWMLTIVWLPVATALVGQLPVDTAQKVAYIGSLLATSLVLLITRLYIRRHPELHSIPEPVLRSGMIATVVMSALFAAALVVSITVPVVGYWALMLLTLTGPLVRVARRRGR